MNPIESVSSVFRNFFNFNGRAQRSEFWWFVLFAFISQAILNFIPFIGSIYSLVLLLPSLAVTARRLHDTNRTAWWMLLYLVPVLGFIVLVIAFLSLLGADALSPWGADDVEWGILGILFLVWLFGSIAAWILLLIFQIMPGTVGPNRYGPDPLQQAATASGFHTPGQPHNVPPHTGGYGYREPDAGTQYSPPPTGAYGTTSEPTPQPRSTPGNDPGPGQRRFCTQCGTQMQPDARFCTYCGTAI